MLFIIINMPAKDNAALAMIERSADAWEHTQFKDVIVRAANVEMYVLIFLVLLKLTFVAVATTKL